MKYIYLGELFYLNIFLNVIILVTKAEFSESFLSLLLPILKTVVLLYIYVENVICHHSKVWAKKKLYALN